MSNAVAVSALCRARGISLGTAESCTGGMVAARITALPGASAFFLGGVVCYSNALKTALLGVPEATLRAKGAVSAEVAAAMAEGACRALGVDAAVAVTGIAGPDGGTPAKPVGTVFLAASRRGETIVERHHWSGNRSRIRNAAAAAALRLVLRLLSQS
jgi:PncC family amidohydrolase